MSTTGIPKRSVSVVLNLGASLTKRSSRVVIVLSMRSYGTREAQENDSLCVENFFQRKLKNGGGGYGNYVYCIGVGHAVA
jgi:hypothetical protein